MSFNLDQVMQTFIQEAQELLQTMEECLLQLENDPSDSDNIGAVFRAAHTIKGSAGLFGLTAIVSFTHILEDILDHVRDGTVTIDKNLIALLLESGDHLQELLNVTAIEASELSEAALARENDLRKRLLAYQKTNSEKIIATPATTNSGEAVYVYQEDSVSSDLWHISLRFGADVYRNGMDPLSFLRYLGTMGSIVRVTTLIDGMPELDVMDAE